MSVVGFYGKLPAFGDFLRRRLSDEFIEQWDRWLTECLVDSNKRLGAQWMEIYLSSPIWRFALGPGVCGSHPVLGIVMPSVDSVGRAYPFSVVLEADRDDFLLASGLATVGWYDELEALALDAIEEEGRFDLAALELALAEHGERLIEGAVYPTSGDEADTTIETSWVISLAPGVPWADGMVQAMEAACRVSDRRFSVWWTEGSERVHRTVLFVEGLPRSTRFDALMTGVWPPRDGWRTGTAELNTGEKGVSTDPAGSDQATAFDEFVRTAQPAHSDDSGRKPERSEERTDLLQEEAREERLVPAGTSWGPRLRSKVSSKNQDTSISTAPEDSQTSESALELTEAAGPSLGTKTGAGLASPARPVSTAVPSSPQGGVESPAHTGAGSLGPSPSEPASGSRSCVAAEPPSPRDAGAEASVSSDRSESSAEEAPAEQRVKPARPISTES